MPRGVYERKKKLILDEPVVEEIDLEAIGREIEAEEEYQRQLLTEPVKGRC